MPGIVGTITELGLKLESKKTDGERVYWITAGKGPACEPGNSAPARALPMRRPVTEEVAIAAEIARIRSPRSMHFGEAGSCLPLTGLSRDLLNP